MHTYLYISKKGDGKIAGVVFARHSIEAWKKASVESFMRGGGRALIVH